MLTDTSPLALSANAQPSALVTAVPWEVAWPRLPGKVRAAVLSLDAAMREIDAYPKVLRGVMAVAAKHAGRAGWSAERLKKHFYAWRHLGMAALIDHRQCGGCGVMGCSWARSSRLPVAVVDRWAGEAGTNDKRALKEAWRVILRELVSGKPVVEGVTWQTLHMEVWPGLALASACPWSVNHPPPGWSLANFMAKKPVKSVYLAMKKGAAAAWNNTPDVRMDLGELRPFEAVVFDDHDLDFNVQVWDDRGKVQVVKMTGLFAMDVATGAVIEFGLRPAILREDGTRMGVTTRDMQHLVAHILARYGFPLDYQMTLIVENAAAALTEETERLIVSRTGGQVQVRRTGVHFGAVNVRGFPERWGAPRGKAWVESWFNLFDITLGGVKGQKGSNWTVKPGHTDGALALAEKMAAIVTAHPDLAHQLEGPLHWASDAHWIVKGAIDAINGRTDHGMERHQMVTEWRFAPSDPVAKPTRVVPGMDAAMRQSVEWFASQPLDVQTLLINNHGVPRRESPVEKMGRMWRREKFAVIPPDTLLDLLMDSAPAIYRGGEVIDVEVGRSRARKVLRFVKTEQSQVLALGAEVVVRLDVERPGAGAWLHDAKERFLGYWAFQRDPRMLVQGEDLEILQSRLGAKVKAHAELIGEAARLVGKTPAARAERAAREENMQVIETLGIERPERAALPSESSTTLSATILNQSRPEKVKRVPLPRARPLPPRPAADDDDGDFSFA